MKPKVEKRIKSFNTNSQRQTKSSLTLTIIFIKNMDTNKNEKVKRKLFFIVNPWLESKEFADIVIKEVYKFSEVYKKEDYI